jgi:hypothetical protein
LGHPSNGPQQVAPEMAKSLQFMINVECLPLNHLKQKWIESHNQPMLEEKNRTQNPLCGLYSGVQLMLLVNCYKNVDRKQWGRKKNIET